MLLFCLFVGHWIQHIHVELKDKNNEFLQHIFWGAVPKEICNNNGIYTPDLKFGILPENQRLEDEFPF